MDGLLCPGNQIVSDKGCFLLYIRLKYMALYIYILSSAKSNYLSCSGRLHRLVGAYTQFAFTFRVLSFCSPKTDEYTFRGSSSAISFMPTGRLGSILERISFN